MHTIDFGCAKSKVQEPFLLFLHKKASKNQWIGRKKHLIPLELLGYLLKHSLHTCTSQVDIKFMYLDHHSIYYKYWIFYYYQAMHCKYRE